MDEKVSGRKATDDGAHQDTDQQLCYLERVGETGGRIIIGYKISRKTTSPALYRWSGIHVYTASSSKIFDELLRIYPIFSQLK